MKRFFRKILLGDSRIEEYSTITAANGVRENVFFTTGKFNANISQSHWLLSLDPIVLGVWLKKDKEKVTINAKAKSRIYFCTSAAENFAIARKNAIAVSKVIYLDKIEDTEGALYLLKVVHSRIFHVNIIKTRVFFFKYYKKPQWPFAKYKSLIAAYSFPRKVRIVSFKLDDYFNIFPMDLLGEIPRTNKYVFGLRHTNITLPKIIEFQKIVVSEVPYIYKDTIYALGKHHGGQPLSIDALPFEVTETGNFGFFIPQWADSYKEIRILKTINLGSHMLLWGEVLTEKILQPSRGNLYHIHFLLYHRQKLKNVTYPLV
ncbi:MAG: hypothetical protein ABI416_07985 [Ginsengibacter sp.]